MSTVKESYDYVIVGAGVTAASAVQGIRSGDEAGTIAVLGSEPAKPVYRPALSKDLWLKDDETLEGQWAARLADPGDTHTWIAERDGEAVGLASARATGPGQVRPLELTLLYVLAAEQGRRTGLHLLRLAVGDAPCFLWVVDGNDRAVDFYRRQGFELDGARREQAAHGLLPELRMVR